MCPEIESARVCVPLADVKERASIEARLTSQLLYGEQVEKLAADDEWVLVRNGTDGYEGYVHESFLSTEISSLRLSQHTSHFVSARSSLLFAEPDIKSPILARLPFGSRLSANPSGQASFLQTSDHNFVWQQHCLPSGERLSADMAAVSEKLFLGVPYLWGGRSSDGFDCSGLVQMAAFAVGLALPRDSHQQELFVAERVEPGSTQRGDLVFWPGHVGLLVAADSLLHATAHTLDSRIEPLQDVVDRAGQISSIRRLPVPR